MTDRELTRRALLRGAVAGGAGLAAGLPQLGCALRGTARSGAAGGRLRLCFYTDVHARTEWDTPLALERAAAAINAQRPDLVVAGGDLITDGFQSAARTVEPRWEAYMASLHRAIEADLYPAIGNHDLVAALPEDGSPPSPEPRAIFLGRMGLERTWYSFDAAGYRFFVIDAIDVTGDELKYQGRVGREQLAWLERELAGLPAEAPLVLVTHMPLLTSYYAVTLGMGEAAPRNRVVTNNRDVLRPFRGRNLVLVLQGHLHVNELLRWRTTTFLTGGALSGKWWRGSFLGTPPGFCLVTLDGGRVEWEYLEYGWEPRRPPDR